MNTAKSILVGLFVFLLALILLFGVGWLSEGNDFFMYKFFAPKREAVRRQVFENTKSYTQGMVQELRGYQVAYLQAGTNSQMALASVILHEYADYPDDKLPSDLRQFMQTLRAQQGY